MPSWAILVPSRGRLGLSWVILGPSWGVWEPSWSHFEAFAGTVEHVLRLCGDDDDGDVVDDGDDDGHDVMMMMMCLPPQGDVRGVPLHERAVLRPK